MDLDGARRVYVRNATLWRGVSKLFYIMQKKYLPRCVLAVIGLRAINREYRCESVEKTFWKTYVSTAATLVYVAITKTFVLFEKETATTKQKERERKLE